MKFWHFLLAIFAGRFVRFLTLSLLTIKFGPQFVEWSGKLFSEHFNWVLAAVAVGLAAWLVLRRRAARKKNSAADAADESQRTQRTA